MMPHLILIHQPWSATAIHHTVSISSLKPSASRPRGNTPRPLNEPNSIPEHTCRGSVSRRTLLPVTLSLISHSARRYAPRIEELRHSPHPGITTSSLASALLTDRNVLLHKSRHGRKLSPREICGTWLDGVIEARDNDDLGHPSPAPWDLDSPPQQRIVDMNDRPEDEWNNIAYQRSIRRRGRQLGARRGEIMSERYP
jgi:hypothetical protein